MPINIQAYWIALMRTSPTPNIHYLHCTMNGALGPYPFALCPPSHNFPHLLYMTSSEGLRLRGMGVDGAVAREPRPRGGPYRFRLKISFIKALLFTVYTVLHCILSIVPYVLAY